MGPKPAKRTAGKHPQRGGWEKGYRAKAMASKKRPASKAGASDAIPKAVDGDTSGPQVFKYFKVFFSILFFVFLFFFLYFWGNH